MPVEAKPLFRPDVLCPRLAGIMLPAQVGACRPRLENWTKLLSSKAAETMKETALLGDFIHDVFGD